MASSPSSTASSRLRYVCGLLWIKEQNNGEIPFEYDPSSVDLSPQICYDLLARAMDDLPEEERAGATAPAPAKTKRSPTARDLWNLVNVLYLFFTQLHDPLCPVNAAILPDSSKDKTEGVGVAASNREDLARQRDVRMKQAMKGEMVSFLVRTARDFATSAPPVEASIVGITASNFSRLDWNGVMWKRQTFTVGGRTAYALEHQSLYLYYRANAGKWVIDDDVLPYGSAYSVSDTSDMNGPWSTSSTWTANRSITVTVQSATQILVQGCVGDPDSSTSCSHLDNGVYELDPEKVNGQNHYVLNKAQLRARGERRHLIYSLEEKCWKITPVCTEEEGAFLRSELGSAREPAVLGQGLWYYIPSDVRTVVKFRFVYADELKKPGNRPVSESAKSARHKLTPWNSRNHETMMFSNASSVLAFFAKRPEKMRAGMNPLLLKFLESNRVPVGGGRRKASAPEDASYFHRLLLALTDVPRTLEEAADLITSLKYELTNDGLLKMLAIMTRLRCGLPVVLVGECGCGKTATIKFLAAWLRAPLTVLDIHGGTTEDEILAALDKACIVAEDSPETSVFIFFDEVNTCPHVSLVADICVNRRRRNESLPENLLTLCALNPYRVRDPNRLSAGNALALSRPVNLAAPSTQGPDLVYLVHSVPATLMDLAFDFGALEPMQEAAYVQAMTSTALRGFADEFDELEKGLRSPAVQEIFTEWIITSQSYVRHVEGDAAAASLRDVKRALDLTRFFLQLTQRRAKKSTDDAFNPYISTLRSAVLALAFSYVLRMPSEMLRAGAWKSIAEASPSKTPPEISGKNWQKKSTFEDILASAQKSFCATLVLDPGIAMNDALSENVFALVVCVLNKLPIFLVGKPGTSKNLALQVASANLQGTASPHRYWRQFPALALFTYQCSPMSTAGEIQRQYDVAKRFQLHSEAQRAVFVLDEVGLAESSPDMPLKVLHAMLLDSPVAVVGLSNWTLDRAKMNRAVLVTRPDPDLTDLNFTGDMIQKSLRAASAGEPSPAAEGAPFWLSAVVDVFFRLYRGQQREFYGMRDFYALVRSLKSKHDVLTKEDLILSVCRNLGGQPDRMEEIVNAFVEAVVFPAAQ